MYCSAASREIGGVQLPALRPWVASIGSRCPCLRALFRARIKGTSGYPPSPTGRPVAACRDALHPGLGAVDPCHEIHAPTAAVSLRLPVGLPILDLQSHQVRHAAPLDATRSAG